MAKRKTLPPHSPLLKSYTESDKINSVSEGAEVLYCRLIAQCDDFGRFYGEAKWVLAKLFTARMLAGTLTCEDIEKRIGELVNAGLIETYESKGTRYIEIVNPFKIFRSDYTPRPVFPTPGSEFDTSSTLSRDEFDTKSAESTQVVVCEEDAEFEPDSSRVRDEIDTSSSEVDASITETKALTKARTKSRAVAHSPPSVDDVRTYCESRGNAVDPEQFIDHYTANGWKQSNGNSIRDWKAAVRTWERRSFNNRGSPQGKPARELAPDALSEIPE